MSAATDRRVGLLGTGLMGTAMAHRLLNQGVAVVAWDRQRDHAQPLAERGADVASTAGEVVSSAQAVITMLPTAEIVLSVVEPARHVAQGHDLAADEQRWGRRSRSAR